MNYNSDRWEMTILKTADKRNQHLKKFNSVKMGKQVFLLLHSLSVTAHFICFLSAEEKLVSNIN